MRKPAITATAETSAALPASRDRRAVELVCLALALGLLAIVARIASVW